LFETRVQPRVRLVELHVAQRDARQHEIGRSQSRILRQRFPGQALRRVEIERLRELHVREPYVGFGMLRRFFQDLVYDLFGMTGIVFFQEQLGAPQQRLRVTLERALRLVEGVVGVLRTAQQVRRPAHHRETFAVVRRDALLVVVLDQRHQRDAGRFAFALLEQHLAEQQSSSTRRGIFLERPQRRLGLLELAGPAQRLALDHRGFERLGRTERLGLACGRDRRVVAARDQQHIAEADQRGTAPWSDRRGAKVRFRCRVVAGVQPLAADDQPLFRCQRRRRASRGSGHRGTRARRAPGAAPARDQEQGAEQ
jgi:hypothetical protein